MTDKQDLIPSDNQGDVIIYQSEDGKTKIDVRFVDETVWLSQQQMAELFQTARTNMTNLALAAMYPTFLKKENLMKNQPVNIFDRFAKKEIEQFLENCLFII